MKITLIIVTFEDAMVSLLIYSWADSLSSKLFNVVD